MSKEKCDVAKEISDIYDMSVELHSLAEVLSLALDLRVVQGQRTDYAMTLALAYECLARQAKDIVDRLDRIYA